MLREDASRRELRWIGTALALSLASMVSAFILAAWVTDVNRRSGAVLRERVVEVLQSIQLPAREEVIEGALDEYRGTVATDWRSLTAMVRLGYLACGMSFAASVALGAVLAGRWKKGRAEQSAGPLGSSGTSEGRAGG